MRRGDEVGDHERRALDRQRDGIVDAALHARADVVADRVTGRRRDRVGILVDREHAADPESRERDGEDARARAQVDRARRDAHGDGTLERLETPRGAAVMTGAERPAGLDDEDDAAIRSRPLPWRRHDEPTPDDDRAEVRTPGLRPAAVLERRDAGTPDHAEPESREALGVGVEALGQHGGRRGLGEERAELRRLARSLLLDDAERAGLPEEVGQPFGRAGRNGEAQLPVVGGGAHLPTPGASSSVPETRRAGDRAARSRPCRTRRAPRAASR